jgi:hypothetical protein
MGVEMELKVVKKGLQFASTNPNTKVVEMVSMHHHMLHCPNSSKHL